MGAHAGEDAAAIFSRKISDCREIGPTFWVAKSAKARPAQVQALCDSSQGYVIFVEPATPGGARPTKESDSATAYSPDRATWLPLPSGIGPVTGQMDHSATALVFDGLTTDVDRTLDLWGYADGADQDTHEVSLPADSGRGAACGAILRVGQIGPTSLAPNSFILYSPLYIPLYLGDADAAAQAR
jgi:hypothetical protein